MSGHWLQTEFRCRRFVSSGAANSQHGTGSQDSVHKRTCRERVNHLDVDYLLGMASPDIVFNISLRAMSYRFCLRSLAFHKHTYASSSSVANRRGTVYLVSVLRVLLFPSSCQQCRRCVVSQRAESRHGTASQEDFVRWRIRRARVQHQHVESRRGTGSQDIVRLPTEMRRSQVRRLRCQWQAAVQQAAAQQAAAQQVAQ